MSLYNAHHRFSPIRSLMAARAAMWGAPMQDVHKCAACRRLQELRPCREAGAVVSTKVGYWAGGKLALFVFEVVCLAVMALVWWRSNISLWWPRRNLSIWQARAYPPLNSAEILVRASEHRTRKCTPHKRRQRREGPVQRRSRTRQIDMWKLVISHVVLLQFAQMLHKFIYRHHHFE